MEVLLEFSNSCDQPIFKQRAVTALKPGRIPLHMHEKTCTKSCACKGIGDIHATHCITVCTI